MQLNWCCKSWKELSKDEFYKISALRIEVFVIEQNCPYQEMDGKDQKSYHLYALDDSNTVIAYLRVVEAGVSYPEISIGRVVVAANHRKHGLGKILMEKSMTWIKETLGDQDIRISAQEYLLNYYNALGFEQVSEMYLEDDIPHIEMIYRKK